MVFGTTTPTKQGAFPSHIHTTEQSCPPCSYVGAAPRRCLGMNNYIGILPISISDSYLKPSMTITASLLTTQCNPLWCSKDA